MKSVFIIAIVAVAMIGVMVPSSFAETYVHDDPKFSINYPSGWIVDDSQNFENYGISFFNDDDWTSNIQVFQFENEDFFAKNIEDLKINQEDVCQNSSFDVEGWICYDFEIISEMVSEDSDGRETLMINYYHVDEYGDEDFSIPYPMISFTMVIIDEDDVWVILSSTEMNEFEFYGENLLNSFTSFQILTNADVLNNSESNLMIDDKINDESFTELPHLEKYLNFDISGWVVSESESFGSYEYGNPVNNYMKVFEKDYGDSSVTFVITEYVSRSDALQRYDEEETKWINFGTPYEKIPLEGFDGKCLTGEILQMKVTGCFVDNLSISMIFVSEVTEQEIQLFTEKLFMNLAYEKFTDSMDHVIKNNILLVPEASETPTIPSWIKNNAGWWADGTIDDGSFIQGLQFLIQENIIQVESKSQKSGDDKDIPTWVKNNAEWWADGTIDDSTFISGIEYLVNEGIIIVK